MCILINGIIVVNICNKLNLAWTRIGVDGDATEEPSKVVHSVPNHAGPIKWQKTKTKNVGTSIDQQDG